MNRRQFLKRTSAVAATLAAASYIPTTFAAEKTRRVGLIGAGWYGKSDLWRLVQVEPVEIVSICDVDKHMLAGAVEIASQRQKSKQKPRTYSDYREMLKEKDLDIVLVGSPDHWHALHAIAAMEAGADVYCQKPISRDVREGEAMLDAARRHKRVVQIGTQRKSTPHLIEAKKQVVEAGLLGKVGHVDLCCYFPMRANGNPPVEPVPDFLDYEMWTGPAPLRPYDGLPHVRWWRTFKEYGNGIVGDMCIHMLDMVRWMMDLGWPREVSSTGGIYVDKNSKANISDTQTAAFDFGDTKVVWTHRMWGEAPDSKYPWSATFYGDKGTLKASVFSYDFTPLGEKAPALHGEPLYEYERYPEDKTEEGLETHCASAIRWHMKDLLTCIAKRGRPVADIEQGYISTASCIMANLSMKLGRSLAWDPAAGKILGDEEANGLLKRPYRAPWVHPEA
jgi:predicted dehydrogenase